MEQPTPGSHDELIACRTLGCQYLKKYHITENMEDLDESIRIFQMAMYVRAPHHESTELSKRVPQDLAGALMARYFVLRLDEDFDRTVRLLSQAGEDELMPDIGRLEIFSTLGRVYQAKYSIIGEMEHLDTAIQFFEQVVSQIPSGARGTDQPFANLAEAQRARYPRTREQRYLDLAIQSHLGAIDHALAGDPDMVDYLESLAFEYRDRFELTEDAADIDESIRFAKQSLELTLSSDLDNLVNRMHLVGNSYRMKFETTKDTSDLESAIRIFEDSASLISPNHPGKAGWMTNLAIAYEVRYDATSIRKDLETAIQIFQEFVDEAPASHPLRAEMLNALGLAYHKRYKGFGDLQDLNTSISLLQESVDTTIDMSKIAGRYANLGLVQAARYGATGDVGDMEAAVQLLQESLDRTPPDQPVWLARATLVTEALRDRFYHSQRMEDLENQIKLLRLVIDKTPEGDLSLGIRLTMLGTAYKNRYVATGSMSDIAMAIDLTSQSLNITPTEYEYSHRGHCLWSLGGFYLARYERLIEEAGGGYVGEDDLETATRLFKESIQETPENDPMVSSRLQYLAAAFVFKYQRDDRVEDLEEAIRLLHQSGDEQSSDRSHLLNQLGIVYADKHTISGAEEDLEKAIQFSQDAVDQTPPGSTYLAGRLYDLGNALYRKYQGSGDFSQYTRVFWKGLVHTNSLLRHRIEVGRALIRALFDNEAWDQASDAVEEMAKLLPLVAPRFLKNADKKHMLSVSAGTGSVCTAFLLAARKSPGRVIEILESFRDVMSESIRGLRVDISLLSENEPLLAERFMDLRNKLDTSTTAVHLSPYLTTDEARYTTSGLGLNNVASLDGQNRELSSRFDADRQLSELIEDIRQKPGLENFLTSPTEEDICGAARNGPLVVLNVSFDRCDALIVESHRVRSIPLPSLHIGDMRAFLAQRDLGSTRVLEWLWDTVASPVLDALGLTEPPATGDEWPHIWWIPTLELCSFPLHAAGYHKKRSGESVLDRAISTYSSSIRAIIRTRPRQAAQTGSTEALLVAMEDTPGIPQNLPFAAAEVSIVQDILKAMGVKPVEPKRRKKDVLKQLTGSDIFHFAGHGGTNIRDPLKSCLLLEDRDSDLLTMESLLDINLHEHAPFLAYLSACGTGRVAQSRFADESMHLINACQLAGFRHVIGTLWEVSDEGCVDMARRTYEGLRDGGGLTDESVARALHQGTIELRDRWLSSRSDAGLDRKMEMLGMRDAAGLVKDDPSARDILTACDDDDDHDDDGYGPANWVPYVHFGV